MGTISNSWSLIWHGPTTMPQICHLSLNPVCNTHLPLCFKKLDHQEWSSVGSQHLLFNLSRAPIPTSFVPDPCLCRLIPDYAPPSVLLIYQYSSRILCNLTPLAIPPPFSLVYYFLPWLVFLNYAEMRMNFLWGAPLFFLAIIRPGFTRA